jgi:Acetoacetate decarboxylase (ADC)
MITATKPAVKLSNEKEITLPIHYKNWKWMMATFTVSARQIKKLLPPGLKPILMTPAKALISFGAYEYPEVSSLQPYNEFLVSFPVQYKPSINLPFLPAIFDPLFPSAVYTNGASYIFYLPVTTLESCKAGREIWGFPKVVREMEFAELNDRKACRLINDGKLEMEIQIKKYSIPNERKNFVYCSFTEKDGKLLKTCVNATGSYIVKKAGAKAIVKFGEGKIAEELRQLNISMDPVHVFFAENVESDLPYADEIFPK